MTRKQFDAAAALVKDIDQSERILAEMLTKRGPGLVIKVQVGDYKVVFDGDHASALLAAMIKLEQADLRKMNNQLAAI